MTTANGSAITFHRPDGGTTTGYLSLAAENHGAGRPGVIVIQEWWGLNDHIRAVTNHFAAVGYNALAPDLYAGRVAKDADEASHMMNALDFAGATHQDIRAAVDHLHVLGSKVGVVGFCMGGALSIAAAVHVPGIDCAVCFYGIPPAEFASPADIKVPFQGHFASQDDWCTPAAVDGLVAAMQSTPYPAEVYRYNAQHAFFNSARPEVFDADAAAQAWQRTLAFFATHLG